MCWQILIKVWQVIQKRNCMFLDSSVQFIITQIPYYSTWSTWTKNNIAYPFSTNTGCDYNDIIPGTMQIRSTCQENEIIGI